MKKELFFLALMCISLSCSQKKSENVNDTNSPLPETSVYWMENHWKNQDGKDLQLNDLRGKVVVMAMIFTSCRSSCPKLVADVQSIEHGLDPELLNKTTFVLCSIDPSYDTPERLNAYAKEHHLSTDQWTLLTANDETVRELSALLGVKFKKTAPMEFSHSNIISVLNSKGEIFFQQEGINNDPQPMIEKINQLAF
jgi:protein SCO1/2